MAHQSVRSLTSSLYGPMSSLVVMSIIVVIGKLDDGVGTVGCDVVVGVQSVQQWGENNALGTSCAECGRG